MRYESGAPRTGGKGKKEKRANQVSTNKSNGSYAIFLCVLKALTFMGENKKMAKWAGISGIYHVHGLEDLPLHKWQCWVLVLMLFVLIWLSKLHENLHSCL